jgi:hypothetical protein
LLSQYIIRKKEGAMHGYSLQAYFNSGSDAC